VGLAVNPSTTPRWKTSWILLLTSFNASTVVLIFAIILRINNHRKGLEKRRGAVENTHRTTKDFKEDILVSKVSPTMTTVSAEVQFL